MVGVQSVLEGVVRTFGPFLIPVTVFAIGVVGYTVLLLLSRQFRPEREEGVVNLSAGTPERSATDNEHGASIRGVRPGTAHTGGDDMDDDSGTTDTSGVGDVAEDGVGDVAEDGVDTDGAGRSDSESAGEAADGRTGDTPRHND